MWSGTLRFTTMGAPTRESPQRQPRAAARRRCRRRRSASAAPGPSFTSRRLGRDAGPGEVADRVVVRSRVDRDPRGDAREVLERDHVRRYRDGAPDGGDVDIVADVDPLVARTEHAEQSIRTLSAEKSFLRMKNFDPSEMRQFFPCAPNIAYSFKAEPSLHRSIAAHQENPTPKPTSINRLPDGPSPPPPPAAAQSECWRRRCFRSPRSHRRTFRRGFAASFAGARA